MWDDGNDAVRHAREARHHVEGRGHCQDGLETEREALASLEAEATRLRSARRVVRARPLSRHRVGRLDCPSEAETSRSYQA